MKAKLSVTIDTRLVKFLDHLSGESRSAKLEDVVRRFKAVHDDIRLRRALAAAAPTAAEREESDAWRRTMEADQWRK